MYELLCAICTFENHRFLIKIITLNVIYKNLNILKIYTFKYKLEFQSASIVFSLIVFSLRIESLEMCPTCDILSSICRFTIYIIFRNRLKL